MRVLFLSDFFLSGQTTHVLELAKQLNRLGAAVHIAFNGIYTPLFTSEYAPRLRTDNISFSKTKKFSSLVKLARKWRPNLIHSQSSTLLALGQKLAAKFSLPHLLTCHGLGFSHKKYQPYLQEAQAVIAIGPKVAREIAEFEAKITIIPNGIDTETFTPPKLSLLKPRRQIIYVGRLEKSRLHALARAAEFHNSHFGAPLKIISDWDPHLPNTDRLPWQVDLVPHLQRAGIVIACGRTAREALSCGCAVLLLQRRYDGIISPELVLRPDFDFSGNVGRFSFQRLERDLKKLLSSNSRLKRLQKWGRRYAVENLSSLEMAKETMRVYEKAKRN
ncbi:MAG TPA: glycosyltransferase family 4 protein [Firmicutes bacterium]|nr:glycosyltransferase family 4 protein [Bacillota bacterium]